MGTHPLPPYEAISGREEQNQDEVVVVSHLCNRCTLCHLPGLLHHTPLCCWQRWDWRMPKELLCHLSSCELRLDHNLHLHSHCLLGAPLRPPRLVLSAIPCLD